MIRHNEEGGSLTVPPMIVRQRAGWMRLVSNVG
jgi:hypothetical protein